jgi:NTP pyrophosphatase (non-canonical NTP hydrolase)
MRYAGWAMTPAAPVGTARRPRIVISGSFKRAPDRLRADFDELRALGYEVLSPSSVKFTSIVDGFAYTEETTGQSPEMIESNHLRAIADADFVWLHAPDGYLGVSAAMEIGYAHACGVPVFSRDHVTDVTLSKFVETVATPTDAIDGPRSASSVRAAATFSPLRAMQLYYRGAAVQRGYEQESLRDTLLLLTEEVGELARAIRKSLPLQRHGNPIHNSVGDEVSDVFLYVLHLANVGGIDLAEAVAKKEAQNIQRAQARRNQQ